VDIINLYNNKMGKFSHNTFQIIFFDTCNFIYLFFLDICEYKWFDDLRLVIGLLLT